MAKSEVIEGVGQSEIEKVLYHITHDLRAMLRATTTLPKWIREDLCKEGVDISEQISAHLDMLEQQAGRADHFLLALRSYSRVGRLADEPEHHELAKVLQEEWVKLEARGHELRVDLAVREVFGPRNELGEVFGALLSNAVVHHDGASGCVRVKARKQGEMIQIVVEDDGPGIAPEFRERVFDMTQRLVSRDECEGSGMGLTIARKAVQNWGGHIALHGGDNGRGTVVEMAIPLR